MSTIELNTVRAILACPGGGTIAMLGVPGLSINPRGNIWINPEGVQLTFKRLLRLGLSYMVLLVRHEECPLGTLQILRNKAREYEVRLVALGIDDYSIPSDAWLRAWRKIEPLLLGKLSTGSQIGLCCAYGAGRSGMIAAYMLTRKGIAPQEALRIVQRAFPEAVECSQQEEWLLSEVAIT